jgi:glycosyltransferase involved in cell wall biosynthesis
MLGWIPDFQHRLLPEFFSAAAIAERDSAFGRICHHSTLIIVSSDASRADLADFRPAAADRARVLHFVASPPASETLPSSEVLRERYDLPDVYLHLPNQFWAHKNHALVVEALGVLRERGGAPTVIATGDTRDPRRPDHYDSLRSRAEKLGIGDRFRALGLVPYEDMAALMRDSAAVLNPSRCEGWSTSVEEAKSMGKRVLLSDLAVHLEQAPERGIYFGPDDAEALAKAIATVIAEMDPVAERASQEAAAAALPRRRLEYARSYERVVREAVALMGT